MPLHPAPLRSAAALIALAMLAGGASAAPLARPASAVEGSATAAAALATAQDRAARATAAIGDLKRELSPGHLTDPMPETDAAFGLASLRSDYADAQRRAAGYRATLGDRHPTLLATELLMEDLRAQLLDGTRKALASAERDAASARADVAVAERRLSLSATVTDDVAARSRAADMRAADATGSVAAPSLPVARAFSPLSLPPSAAPTPIAAAAAQPVPAGHRSSSMLVAVLAAAALAALLAAWAALRLLAPSARPAPARAVPPQRVEPALATTAPGEPRPAEPTPSAPEAPEVFSVPVLDRLALPGTSGGRDGSSGASPAAALHATLRAAFGGPGRMTVLVTPASHLPVADADATAFAVAAAAAAAGRRPLLMEARAAGRLRGALVPPTASALLIAAGGTSRTLYRLGRADAVVSLLPSDAGEAEAARAAEALPGTARLEGLGTFDTVILVGDDPTALAANADLLLLAAPADADPAALAAAALPFGDARRLCGAVLVETLVAADAAPLSPPRPAAPRRRPVDPVPASRFGLRGSIEPTRRRIAG